VSRRWTKLLITLASFYGRTRFNVFVFFFMDGLYLFPACIRRITSAVKCVCLSADGAGRQAHAGPMLVRARELDLSTVIHSAGQTSATLTSSSLQLRLFWPTEFRLVECSEAVQGERSVVSIAGAGLKLQKAISNNSSSLPEWTRP